MPRPSTWPAGWSGPWWVEHRGEAGGGRTAAGWTRLGSLGGPQRALVDPGGYLQAAGAGWGVDWWVGAEDRWHVPARQAAVRQSLVASAPVVATAVRVPGGDVSATAAVHVAGGRSLVAVEVADDSPAPVALALAVRPVTLHGVGAIGRVALEGTTVLVDGVPVLHLPGRPGRVLRTRGADGDPLPLVEVGAAGPAEDGETTCTDRLAGIVVLLPLAHRARLTWQLDLTAATPPPRRRLLRRPPAPAPPPAPVAPARVAAGWASQLARRPRLDLPAGRSGTLLTPLTAHLLLAAGEPGAPAEVLAAAAMAGVAERAPDLAGPAAGEDPAGPAVTLWAAAVVADLGGPRPGVPDVATAAEVVAAGAAARPGDLGAQAVATAALAGAGRLLAAAGEGQASVSVAAWADEAAGRAAAAPGGAPSGAPLAALWAQPGGPPPPGKASPARDLAAAGRRWAAGDPSWWASLEEVAAVASPTAAWPDLREVPGGAGCGADGHDPAATARAWALLRAAVVTEGGGAPRLELLRVWPEAWDGVQVEAHDLPTRWGRVSLAVRWHGERPALLWEVAGAPAGLVVVAPGLDASWSSGDATGEALLAGPDRDR